MIPLFPLAPTPGLADVIDLASRRKVPASPPPPDYKLEDFLDPARVAAHAELAAQLDRTIARAAEDQERVRRALADLSGNRGAS